MKKNLFTLIIIVLLLVNTALTAIMAIMIIPETQNVNALVAKVAAAIDLDTEAGIAADATVYVPLENIATYSLADGEAQTMTLKPDADGSPHYVVMSVSISMDITQDDYATYNSGDLSTYDTQLQDLIGSTISQYTLEEFTSSQTEIKKELTEQLQTMFQSRFIIGVNFYGVTTQ